MAKFNDYTNLLGSNLVGTDELGIWHNGEFSNVEVGEFVSYLAANMVLNVSWANISSTPTTISGYGIADAYTKSEVDVLIGTGGTDVYTKGEVDTLVAAKADTSHDHVELDITDLDKYTQEQINNRQIDAGYF